MKETAQFETITPEMATALLDKNYHNRHLNKRNLDKVIMEINRGNFKITGESVKLSESDILLDGQHRLWGIVKTGKPQTILVIRNLDEDVFKYLDTGKTRNAADVLAIEGIANPGRMSSIARFIINFSRGHYFAVANSNIVDKAYMITNADTSKFVNDNLEALVESSKYGFNKYNKLLTGSTLSALHFLFSKISEDSADDFCHKLGEGTNLDSTSPIFVLREKLRTDLRSTRKMRSLEKLALICKAWNLYRTGKIVTVLKWDSIKEPFPKPL